ncbi:hypothetical protein Tco_0983252 [Tanacetum coccineum]
MAIIDRQLPFEYTIASRSTDVIVEGKPVGPYVIKMKNYVAQLERLGYVLPQDLSVGLIMNGLTSNFVGFVRNYNKHNMGKMIGELQTFHAYKQEEGKLVDPYVIKMKNYMAQLERLVMCFYEILVDSKNLLDRERLKADNTLSTSLNHIEILQVTYQELVRWLLKQDFPSSL